MDTGRADHDAANSVDQGADSLAEVAAEAWLYFFPLLVMQLTREVEQDLELNAWDHAGAFRDADFISVIRPNVDTRYSHAWLDLSGGPVALTVPDMAERY